MKTTHVVMIGSMIMLLILAVAPVCATDSSGLSHTDVRDWAGLRDALSESNSGDTIEVYADIHISGDCELESGVTLNVQSGKTITVVRECLFIINGPISGYGTIVNNGYVAYNDAGFSSGIKIIDNNVWVGPTYGFDYEGEGEKGDLFVTDGSSATIQTTDSVSGVILTSVSSTDYDISLSGRFGIVIPSSGIPATPEPVIIIMAEIENESNVEGKLYSVKVAGIDPCTLEIKLPSSSSDDRVYHVVNGVVREEMAIDSRTTTSVTFTTTHNSEFAVGTVSGNDPDNRTNHDVTINSGAGFTVNKSGSSTQAGMFVFNVLPRDGYEIVNVHASNGTVTKNGYEYTLSGVTADTTVYITAIEKESETEQEDTSSYLVIGAAVGVIIVLSLAALMLFKKS